MSCVCPLINYTIATEENVCNVRVCAICNQFPITWNEFYLNTQPETISYICTRYIFQMVFRENIRDFTELHNEKINLEVMCKQNCFDYWNSCKRLPNFINVTALITGTINLLKCFLNFITDTQSWLLNTICLKTLLQKGTSEPVFYGDLVCEFKRIIGKPSFSG